MASPRMSRREALETLGLSAAECDRRSVDRAWRRFARRHHPDMCPGDPGACERFARGREAREVLRGPTPTRAPAVRARAFGPPPRPGHEWVA